jgi:hypothetical protein
MSIQVIASLVKPCKGNRMSTWTFFNDNDTYYARNDQGKQVNCSSVEDARNFYTRMLSYGFQKPEMTKQMINVTPIHSSVIRMPKSNTPVQGLNRPLVTSWV